MSRKKVVWTGRDGTKYTMSEITNSHLLNILKYMEVHWEQQAARLMAYAEQAASFFDAEEASYYFDNVARQYEEAWGPEDIFPEYEVMHAEATKRGLI